MAWKKNVAKKVEVEKKEQKALKSKKGGEKEKDQEDEDKGENESELPRVVVFLNFLCSRQAQIFLESGSAHARSAQPAQQSKNPLESGNFHSKTYFLSKNTLRVGQNG